MSERYENSLDSFNLLLKADSNKMESGAVHDALVEFQQKYALRQAEQQQLQTLNDLLTSFYKKGKKGPEVSQCKNDANKCIQRISYLENQLHKISSSDVLSPLLKELYEQALKEQEKKDKEILEEYRRQVEELEKQIIRDWEESRRLVETKRQIANAHPTKDDHATEQKRIANRLRRLENEIAEKRQQEEKLLKEIKKLRWCLFGKKKLIKTKLESDLLELQSELSSLYLKIHRIKNKEIAKK